MNSRYITLGELLRRFKAEITLSVAGLVAEIEAMKKYEPNQLLDVCSRQDREEVRSLLVLIQPNLKDMGLRFSLAEITTTLLILDNPQTRNRTVTERMTSILNRITDELESSLLFSIKEDKRHFVENIRSFGDEVAGKFPSAAFDIEEAGKCLAFERYTACVYHLMRVAATAWIAIGERVGYESPKPGWGELLNFVDAGLEKARRSYKEASPLFQGNIEFLSGVSAQMHAVNQAWRQRVAHIERTYSEEEALRIWEATKGLMQRLAFKLKEAPSG